MLDKVTPEEHTETLVSLEELKNQVGITLDCTDHDDRLTGKLLAARDQLEEDCDTCFTPQIWQQRFNWFCPCLQLLKRPVTSATIEYYNSENELVEFEDDFTIINYPTPKLIIEGTLPATYDRWGAVQVTLCCGPEEPPPLAKEACLQLLASWDFNRQGEVVGTIATELKQYQRILDILKRKSFI